DLGPPILEQPGIPQPDSINGTKQIPIEGVSMAYTWDNANAAVPTRHTTQYFEMLGNRAIYQDGWVAATTPATLPWELSTKTPPDVITEYNWELCNVEEDDPTQINHLAAKMPEKLKKRQALFDTQPTTYNHLTPNTPTPQPPTEVCYFDARVLEPTAPMPYGGSTGFLELWRIDRLSERCCSRHQEQVLHDHRQPRDS